MSRLAFIMASCGIASIEPVSAAPSKPAGPPKSNVPAIIPRQDRPFSPDPRLLIERPRQYHVIMLNDDYTPMGFVETVLQKYFRKAAGDAHRIMLQVHSQGRAVAGTYSHEVAEHKARLVENEARRHQFPFALILDRA